MSQEGVCGGFDWSYTHNSPFELSKTALINFIRTHRDAIPDGLSLDWPNTDRMVSTSIALPVASYKYLGVLFNPKLHWSLQHAKALMTATFRSSKLWCILKSASGLSTKAMKQLLNTIVVPRFTYSMEVWYTYLHKPGAAGKTRGSVSITNKLGSVQHKVAISIMGGLNTVAGDVMNTHMYILPVDLLFCKLLICAVLHLCSLPAAHPLCPLVRSTVCWKVKHHHSPIHHLINFSGLNPNKIKTISPVRRSPGYSPVFEIVILPLKEAALPFAILINTIACKHMYTDSSGFKNIIGASALLYITDHVSGSLCFYLGRCQEHTVYEVEGGGMIMGLHLLSRLSCKLTCPTVLGTDSQVVIRWLNNQLAHLGQYLLNAIHQATKQLHKKQDGLINRTDHLQTIEVGE